MSRAFLLDLERLRAQGVAWCTEIEFEALINIAEDRRRTERALRNAGTLVYELVLAFRRGHEHEIDEALSALVSALSVRALDEPEQGRDPSAAVEDSASRPSGSSNEPLAEPQP